MQWENATSCIKKNLPKTVYLSNNFFTQRLCGRTFQKEKFFDIKDLPNKVPNCNLCRLALPTKARWWTEMTTQGSLVVEKRFHLTSPFYTQELINRAQFWISATLCTKLLTLLMTRMYCIWCDSSAAQLTVKTCLMVMGMGFHSSKRGQSSSLTPNSFSCVLRYWEWKTAASLTFVTLSMFWRSISLWPEIGKKHIMKADVWHVFWSQTNVDTFGSPLVWISMNFNIPSHGIGDVGGELEIRFGIWHHGRVATHGDYQKNHFRKDFPAILFLCYEIYTISPILLPDHSSKIHFLSIFSKELRGNIFYCGFSDSLHVWLPCHDAKFPIGFHAPHRHLQCHVNESFKMSSQ